MLYWSKENLQEQKKAKEERLKQLHSVGFNEFLVHIDEWWRLLNEALNMRVDGFGAGSGGYSRGSSGGWNIRFNRGRRKRRYSTGGLIENLPKFQTGGQIGNLTHSGKLSGYGGGDRRLALLEDGEFVMRKEAVKRIGGANLSALNSLKLPKFSVGGGVSKSVSEIANLSGKEQTSRDVNIRLNFGNGKEASVMSDAQTARNLERYLKSLGV